MGICLVKRLQVETYMDVEFYTLFSVKYTCIWVYTYHLSDGMYCNELVHIV